MSRVKIITSKQKLRDSRRVRGSVVHGLVKVLDLLLIPDISWCKLDHLVLGLEGGFDNLLGCALIGHLFVRGHTVKLLHRVVSHQLQILRIVLNMGGVTHNFFKVEVFDDVNSRFSNFLGE